MTVDDLQNLYSELRGSRSAPAIMDARAHFLERQMQDAHSKLQEAYEKYNESRQRILRQDPEKQVDAKAKDRDQQIRRLKRKQDKAREIIDTFEEYLKQLKRLAEKEQDREDSKAKLRSEKAASEKAASEKVTPQDDVPELRAESAAKAIVTKDSIDKAILEQFSKLIGNRQLDFVSSQFGFSPLAHAADVQADAVYLLRKGDRCLLLNAELATEDDAELTCIDIFNRRNQIRLSREAMVKLSLKRKLVLLLRK